jgi:hypothetical protein
VARLRANFKTGTITDNPLASGATTINSAEFAALPVIAAPNYMPLALDPEGINGAPEIVWVTDHASTATSVTVLRHQEGTLARAHPATSIWANTLTAQDIDELYAAVDAVTAALPSYLPLAGGVMTGLLTLSAPPTADLHAATKKYVDDHTPSGSFLPLSGGTLTGFLILHADPTAANHAATKAYADTKSASNHNHSGVYAPVSHTHAYAPTSHSHAYLPLAGGTITGNVTFNNTDLTLSGGSSSITVGGYIVGEQRLYLGSPLSTSNNGLPGWRHNTSADATFGWEFMRLTSSLRYKRNVKPVDASSLISDLRLAAASLISWQEKGSPKDSPRYIGISAEDAFKIVPTAVVLDEEGRPDAVEPVNAFGVHMIAAIGSLLDRVDALEA